MPVDDDIAHTFDYDGGLRQAVFLSNVRDALKSSITVLDTFLTGSYMRNTMSYNLFSPVL